MLVLLEGVLEGESHSLTVFTEFSTCLSGELQVQVVELRQSAGRGMNQAPLSLPLSVLNSSSIWKQSHLLEFNSNYIIFVILKYRIGIKNDKPYKRLQALTACTLDLVVPQKDFPED